MPYPQPAYPWRKWFSKSRFRLVRGTHFTSQVHGMATLIRLKAKKYGVRVSIHINEDVLDIGVTKR